eukprot:11490458-Alexandrium_andersonii.AAC.1
MDMERPFAAGGDRSEEPEAQDGSAEQLSSLSILGGWGPSAGSLIAGLSESRPRMSASARPAPGPRAQGPGLIRSFWPILAKGFC